MQKDGPFENGGFLFYLCCLETIFVPALWGQDGRLFIITIQGRIVSSQILTNC